jgi:hypothetical protein
VGPWPVVQREEEAIFLRQCVASFIQEIESAAETAGRRQLSTKADLLRALLLVLCPGGESLQVVSLPSTRRVPSLLFAGRIEVQDWQAMAQYTAAEFQRLVDQSLRETTLPSLVKEVAAWLEDCAKRLDTGQAQAYARHAINSIYSGR